MANRSVATLIEIWASNLEWDPLTVHTTFKVFPSRGLWHMLIVKSLLEQIKATQDYRTESISIPFNITHHHIYNFPLHCALPLPHLPSSINFLVHTHFIPPPTKNKQTYIHHISIEEPPYQHQSRHQVTYCH